MRVLIADDQRSFGTALADMVRCCGHEVVAVVGSGLEAIQAFSLHKPDLVLMDHWMPRLNGITASRHIIAKHPAARVVLLSAWSPLDGADESGAMCFLPKPVDLARLNATLLTISQSIAPPPTRSFEAEEIIFQSASPATDEMSGQSPSKVDETSTSDLAAIPPEIISPIETFPAATFPIEEPPPPSDSCHAETPAEGRSPVKPKARSSKPRTRRRKVKSQKEKGKRIK